MKDLIRGSIDGPPTDIENSYDMSKLPVAESFNHG